MQNIPYNFFSNIFCTVFISLTLFGYSTDSRAWGEEGHTAIGVLAIDQLQPAVRSELENIIGPLDGQAMLEACNWPDVIRETEEWAWTAPRHYVNIPRGETSYMESRDCPEQLCATQAIKYFAAELANHKASREQRWQAFAWLCHLAGDLHQPLHAGFADDRGGNNFEIVYKGEEMNLHTLWDHELIERHAGSWQDLVKRLNALPKVQVGDNWSPEMVNQWTNESHKLAEQAVYPASKTIDDRYEKQSWELIQQRISTAASRLALMINSVLKDPAQP
jgi:hypothetical protein